MVVVGAFVVVVVAGVPSSQVNNPSVTGGVFRPPDPAADSQARTASVEHAVEERWHTGGFLSVLQ